MSIAKFAVKWGILCLLVSLLAGSSSALFLYTLDIVTQIRKEQLLLIAFLPLAGIITILAYELLGKDAVQGNPLILKTIAEPSKKILPIAMAPLIYISTLLSHLFGGSAGREGTALQLSASLSDQLTKPFKLSKIERGVLLKAAIAAGFGSVFGTPLAGTIFALECTKNRIQLSRVILPVYICSFLANWVTETWSIEHIQYAITELPSINFRNMIGILTTSIIFGLAAWLFKVGMEKSKQQLAKYIPNERWRVLLGSILISLIVYIFNGFEFVGLGIEKIVDAYIVAAAPTDFALKIFLTILTISIGFKGGEVTPLFFIGATLGSGLSLLIPLPISFLAGMGMVAVFGASAKTPLASAVLAFELFGKEYIFYAFAICIIASFIAGKKSIYQTN